MKFQFVEKRVDVSEALREYAQKKIGKLDKYFKKEADTQVLFSSEGHRKSVEVTVNNDGIFYRSSEHGDDMHTSIDRIVSAIERQIRKNKTRLEKKLRQGAFDRTHAEPPVDIDEEKDFPIIKSKRFKLKPMTAEEAILQMNLLHHEFFVFRNAVGGKFAVVYRRKGAGYGLIEED